MELEQFEWVDELEAQLDCTDSKNVIFVLENEQPLFITDVKQEDGKVKVTLDRAIS